MSTPYIGQILLVGFNFAPQSYALCNGQLLSIADNQALFALIGTTYGGDGINTFGLPDLRGRVPFHQGTGSGLSSYVIGQYGGSENVTLTTAQLPAHSHPAVCADASGDATMAAGNYFAGGPPEVFAPPGTVTAMGSTVGANGSGQPHTNLQPYLTMNYVISVYGIFPSQN